MSKFVFFSLIFLFVLSITTSDLYGFISITVSIIILLQLLLKFGKGIALLELMGLYSCIIYLVFPVIGYSVYTNQNPMAMLWLKYMPVSSEQYFSFVLPAVIIFLIGLSVLNVNGKADGGNNIAQITSDIKRALSGNNKTGWILIAIGLVFFVIRKQLPQSLSFVGTLSHMFIFPGLLYIHFQPKFKGKVFVYVLIAAVVLMDSINSGMFTLLFYMGITMISFFVLNRKIRFSYKLLALAGAIICTITLQLVKGVLRKQTWGKNFAGSRVEVFQGAVVEKASNIKEMFSANGFFPIYARMNQGYNTALVLRRIPRMQDYDRGNSIMLTVAAAFVPRVLWPDKPESGGVYNMLHFAGFQLKGWSANIGPLGEAYGNFGVTGGIIYMFFFGLFISWVYLQVVKLSKKYPLLLLWIPLIFLRPCILWKTTLCRH